jgi:hypothetical protein
MAMTFIPTAPVSSGTPPSPRTRELAGLLGRVLEEYRKNHPSLTPGEIRSAFRLAYRASGGGDLAARRALVLGLAVMVALLGLGSFLFSASEAQEFALVLPLVIMVIVILLLVVLVLVRIRSR